MIGCQRSAATRQIKKNMADAADGEDEFEAVDQRLSESQKFSLYKDLEGYRSLWDTSYVPSKNKHQNKLQKEKGLEELSQKHNLSPGYLKRQIDATRTSLAREIKKQSDGKRSLPTEKELSSRHLCLHTTDQS